MIGGVNGGCGCGCGCGLRSRAVVRLLPFSKELTQVRPYCSYEVVVVFGSVSFEVVIVALLE